MLMCALCADEKYHKPDVLSRAQLFGVHVLGCIVTTVLSGIATYVLIRLTDKFVGVNISIDTEL